MRKPAKVAVSSETHRSPFLPTRNRYGNRYNEVALRALRLTVVLLILAGFAAVQAQAPPAAGTLVVIPFENRSSAPGLEWIGESFPEFLRQSLSSTTFYVVPREDRMRAYERAGIPAEVHPSRATVYRVAEDMGADYVVLGEYDFDGRTFTATAQLLNMRSQQLSSALHESGRLAQLLDIQNALGWDLLQAAHLEPGLSRDAFLKGAPSIRLDAFENYVRGITATAGPEKIDRFRQAIRISPTYTQALLALGKTCLAERQYDQASAALGRIPPSDSASREANFYLGLASYYQGDFSRAETAFNFVASRLPLTEVYNDLGVVLSRRGDKNALEYFRKAVDADPSQPDYHFNLAVALYRSGDGGAAAAELRETLSLRPSDGEAKSLLAGIGTEAGSAQTKSGMAKPAQKVLLERIQPNYDESSFRQLAMKINALAEQRLAKTSPQAHARFHADRGHELLSQGFSAEAEAEFRHAISLDVSNAEAHAGMARILEAHDDLTGARAEAEAALHWKSLAEPLLVLAELDLRDNRTELAAENVERALRLEPSNSQALALKRSIAAKLAQKAQPLPHP